MANNGIIYAYEIMGDGTAKVLQGDDIAKTVKADALAWVHIDGTDPDGRAWLQREISYLDHIIVDALLADETRPRVLEFDQGVLAILRGVNLNENADPEDMISVRIWADDHRIITVRRRKLRAIQDIREKLEEGTGPKGPGDFLAMLSARLFERMEPVFSELDDRLDECEEEVIDDPEISLRTKITEIRKEAIIFRRYVAPQKDVISHLRTSELHWLDTAHKRKLQENLDRITRYIEDLDAIRERAQIVKDELSNVLADRLNKNMYMLSIVAAIFLPLGFLTGLLGINVGGIPGADYGGSFLIFCAILSVVVFFQILLFKWMKWF